MKNLTDAIAFVNKWDGAIDGRDKARFAVFIPFDRFNEFKDAGVCPNDDTTKAEWDGSILREWTEEEVLKQLEKDVRFGLEKAIDKRGLSAAFMLEVVNMWCHLLENGLEQDSYDDYGKSFFEKVLRHYGWSS